uniref:Secreted protein n=1 Tax=Rousettus aegyptiacus TaxID=9407 RepID=A0A7J8HRR2_ROUAE|nr:hypothetical protein HJG63_011110 [Rousettus aegyptiacus]
MLVAWKSFFLKELFLFLPFQVRRVLFCFLVSASPTGLPPGGSQEGAFPRGCRGGLPQVPPLPFLPQNIPCVAPTPLGDHLLVARLTSLFSKLPGPCSPHGTHRQVTTGADGWASSCCPSVDSGHLRRAASQFRP